MTDVVSYLTEAQQRIATGWRIGYSIIRYQDAQMGTPLTSIPSAKVRA